MGSTLAGAFDGTDTADVETNVFADDLPGFGGTDPFTLFATFQTNGAVNNNANATIVGYSPSQGTIGGADIRLFLRGNTANGASLRVEVSAGGGFNIPLADIGGAPLDDGAVHTVAVVADGGENFQDLKIFVDGTLYDGLITGGTNHPIDLLGAHSGTETTELERYSINIGVDRNGRRLNGVIDDVHVFGMALTEAELQNIAANGVVPEPTALSLVALVGAAAFCRRLRS